MKRFNHIAALLVTTVALSASAFAQNGVTPGSSSMSSSMSPSSTVPSGLPSSAGSVTTSAQTGFDQTQTTTTETLAADPSVSAETLPATGGEPMVFVLGGIALMGTALVMRRKATNFG